MFPPKISFFQSYNPVHFCYSKAIDPLGAPAPQKKKEGFAMTSMADALRVIFVLLILGCAFPPILPIMLVLSLAVLLQAKTLLVVVILAAAAGWLYCKWRR